MSVEQLIVNGKPIWKRSGAADFYAVFDHTKAHLPLLHVHYDGRTMYSPFYILEANYLDPQIGIWENPLIPVTRIRGKFESFLFHLYGADLFIADDNGVNDVDNDMVIAGLKDKDDTDNTTPYDDLNILDFMVLTKAKQRYYKKPEDNTIIDLMTLGPNAERPIITDVPDLQEDRALLKAVLKTVGMKGFCQYLYAAEAISFEIFCELIKYFFPDLLSRIDYYNSTIKPFFKARRVPMFDASELEALGIKMN